MPEIEIVYDKNEYNFEELKENEEEKEITQFKTRCNLMGNWVGGGGGERHFKERYCLRPRGGGRAIIIHQHYTHVVYHTIDNTDYTRIQELETQFNNRTNELNDCRKHRNKVKIKINEIITSYLNMNISEVENNNDVEKLNTILYGVINQVNECLKLLGVKFNENDSLMEKLKKLVNACKDLILTGPVQERLWKCLCYVNQYKCPRTFEEFVSNFDKNIDELTKACHGNKKQELNNDARYKNKAFEPKPNISFVGKLSRCHYYMVGKSKETNVVTMVDNLLQACKNIYWMSPGYDLPFDK
ncbi:20485_t:CDS:1 [Dentiscutata erythropus]|uniref:20485_t:CDS:1 n=1 Tax=Dentiscutata erythropus TaxID=1348616 RepID=A0A9N9AIH7_9GLOM|nr:20485_t:CDS:1 [Dentiscutata erythropus]